jgi:hypothetical protein
MASANWRAASGRQGPSARLPMLANSGSERRSGGERARGLPAKDVVLDGRQLEWVRPRSSRCLCHWCVASLLPHGFPAELHGTEEAMVAHVGGLHPGFICDDLRDDVRYPLVVAAGEQPVVQRARHPDSHGVVARAGCWSEPREAEVLEETHDRDQIIQRVAALDIGQGRADLLCAVPARAARAGGCRRSPPTRR